MPNTKISALTVNTDPADDDELVIVDKSDTSMGAGGTNKKLTWLGVKAFLFNTGEIKIWSMKTVPSGYLLCDGSAISRSTYATLFSVLVPTIGTFTVTIATPAVVTLNNHGLITGDAVYFTTSGALPTGLSANTIYYVIKIDANTFYLATSRANAEEGTKIATSGTQSGTHTLKFCPYGLGDGSTTFNIPSSKGMALVGIDEAQTEFKNLGKTYGEKTHALVDSEIPNKTGSLTIHDASNGTNIYTASGVFSGSDVVSNKYKPGGSNNAGANSIFTINFNNGGGNGSHNNIQPSMPFNFIIKT